MGNGMISMNIDAIWTDFVPEPLRAEAWSIEQVGPDPADVRLYFVDANGNFVQVELFDETARGTARSSEFAEDLYDVTGFQPE